MSELELPPVDERSARKRAAAAAYERDVAEEEKEAAAAGAAMAPGAVPMYPAWHAGTVGYIYGFGGVMLGILMLCLTIIAAAGLLPMLPDYAGSGGSPYAWGLVFHAAHWGAWVLCIWTSGLRQRGFLLVALLVHGVAWLADAGVFLLVLLGLLINGIDSDAINLWAGFIAAVLLVLTSAVLASLWTLHVAANLQHSQQQHRRK